ncbi:Bug family tripartite tricarboxylate transporter substrate binding protein [Falsiroseomonas tokyonensis]|uniref:Bug family tripartite tricarboxylate transporter substrate binding protein n=1 Tax=Falsiroseomonas tokyonensis TaxID=430521 RepID=A0ABV7BTZ5_9PROT|nr:tripartite tricarboxylate transporter substrate binding protein [Falsiroseomonas tokyonensis]MBU8537543.1 tripartite tricarboxylate transporter substrate binding protein [Falsiroseomonas tokyonensis]
MRITRRDSLAGLGLATLGLPFLTRPARAQAAWPSRPVRFIVPFAAGGPVEVPARFIADSLGHTLGQPVVVETRPGAGGALGVQAVVQANDPHTLLFTTSSVAIVPALMSNPGYDPFRDLVPITMVSEAPMVLLAKPDHPIKDLADLIARAKARPGAISYASSGVGATTHLGGALLGVRAGIDLLHVPYRGAGQAINALYAGDTDLLVIGTIEALIHVRDGRLKAIAVTSGTRSPALPDTPAIAEAVPGYDMSIWYAMFGPRNTPPEVVDRLAREVAPLARGTPLATRMEESGAQLLLDGPTRLADRLRKEVPQWREVVQRAGIRTE